LNLNLVDGSFDLITGFLLGLKGSVKLVIRHGQISVFVSGASILKIVSRHIILFNKIF
jgi:hypothetical protein